MCSLALANKTAYQVQEGSLIFLLRCQPYHFEELLPSQLRIFPFQSKELFLVSLTIQYVCHVRFTHGFT